MYSKVAGKLMDFVHLQVTMSKEFSLLEKKERKKEEEGRKEE